jgi:serine/threonine protein kinase/WD40 repeat protein
MDPRRWRQIDALLQAALDRRPDERAGFLDEACAGDEGLRSEVESLLSSGDQALSLINRPAFEVAARLFEQSEPELRAGVSIGHYKILSLLGTGGMGEVYLAQDTRLGRKIAIKLLPADHSLDKVRLRRFQQEARAASALNHPNIITIHEIGEVQARHFIATEFIEGQTLRQFLKRKRLDLRKGLEIAIQAASALAAAHEVGIVHRDIKPENIMLRPDGLVKVLDFGLAQLSNAQSSATDTEALTLEKVVTAPGLLMGTVNYMSPEQARGQKLDARSDIFSLGVVLYEMISGRPPFEGETTSDLIAALLKVEPSPIEHITDVAPELQRIVSKALRKDREERYQTVKDLLVDLKSVKRQLAQVVTTSAAAISTDDDARAALSTGDQMIAATGEAGARTAFSVEYLTSELSRHKSAAVLTLVMLTITAATAYVLTGSVKDQNAATQFGNIKLTRVTNSGKAHSPAISPDGQDIAFLLPDGDQEILWIQQVATGSKVRIGPITGGLQYGGLTFSPDGTYLYYVGGGDGEDSRPALYRVPRLGGPTHKVISGVNSSLSLSRDGNRLAFVRNHPNETDVIVANVDGRDEHKVTTRQDPDFFWSVALSPDGTRIACAGMRRGSEERDAKVIEVEVNSGSQRTITTQGWSWIHQVNWLHDNSGLVIIAQDKEESAIQLWFISYPEGEARRITTDLNNYSDLSLTTDSKRLVATQNSEVMNLYIVTDRNAGRAEQVTSGPGRRDGMYGVSWTPDGEIVYSSFASGAQEIWQMEPDGSNQRQLTIDSGQTNSLSVSPDGRYIVYVAVRDGERDVWRINTDGSNPKQLTYGAGALAPYCSADNRWVFYHVIDSGKRITRKVPIDGGEPAEVPDLPPETLSFSPDGKMSIYIQAQDKTKKRIGIISSQGGQPVKLLDLPASAVRVQWLPDGTALTYVDQRTENVWVLPLDGRPPSQVTAFKGGRIAYFAWSSDARQVAAAFHDKSSDVVLITQSR